MASNTDERKVDGAVSPAPKEGAVADNKVKPFAAELYTRKRYTLLFCLRGSGSEMEVMLGMKKRGFGAGKLNGFGGKVEPGETISAAAIRELQEESGVTATKVKQVGIIEFEFTNEPKVLEVHVFLCHDWSGSPVETDEMRPEWHKSTAMPYPKMWSDDQYWLPTALSGQCFQGFYKFLPDQTTIVEAGLETVNEGELAAVLAQQAALPQHRPPTLVFAQPLVKMVAGDVPAQQ